MALQSKTDIYIGGQEISAFKSLTLHQQLDAHHTMELVCRMDVLEDLSEALGASSKNFLGETITLQTASLDTYHGYQSLEFKGIVTKVKTIKGHEAGSGDSVVIKAKSPSVIADDGPNYASFIDMSLSDILTQTFKDYDKSKLEIRIQPNYANSLHYSVQHNESAYAYASRLAAQYGEWFYYNGTQLIFGKPETTTLELTYGFDLKEYHLELVPQTQNYKYYANDYLLNDIHEKATTDINSTTNGYNGFVSKKASTIFNNQTKIWHNHYNDAHAKQRFDTSIALQKKAIEIQQVVFSGVSDNPGVKLGNIVKVEGASYRITSITHTNTENGDYENQFQGVTAELDAYPNTNINAFPKSESQTARVMENADPDGLGRIRVQFPWQRITGEMTPWIRIVTPHAGDDKGFHFIPEINEEVLIGFEGGNAEHPYVMGSLYNGGGKAGAFQNANNDIKAIKTRSGHTLKFTEDESIILTDKSGNILQFDTTGSNITITAPETMTFNCKNMLVNVEENLTTTVGMNKTESVGMNSNESTGMMKSTTVGMNANMMVMGNLMEFIQGDLTSEVVKGREESAAEIKITSNQGNITKNAKGQIQNNSGEKGNNF